MLFNEFQLAEDDLEHMDKVEHAVESSLTLEGKVALLVQDAAADKQHYLASNIATHMILPSNQALKNCQVTLQPATRQDAAYLLLFFCT